MKAILVIDTPKTCGDCPLFVWEKRLDSWYSFCTAKQTLTDENLLNDKPNWCPLRPMPEPKNVEVNGIEDVMHTEYSTDNIYAKYIATIQLATDKLISLGWNACIEELEK